MRVPSLIILLVYALAVARVTRLINEDVLLDGPRERLVARIWAHKYGTHYIKARSESGDPIGDMPIWQAIKASGGLEPKLAYLIGCPWCA